MSAIFNINDLKILTPNGYESFNGISFNGHKSIWAIKLENGLSIKSSDDHNYFVNSIKTKLKNLSIGDELLTTSGYSKIVSITDTKLIENTYDILHVENEKHSFFANDIEVSNCEFLGSSTMLIAPIALEAMKYTDSIETKYNGAMEIWEKPNDKSLYVMGVDTGKGIGADSSTICVLRVESPEEMYQVAIYKSDMILPYDYAAVVNGISDYYNAYIMIENNDQGATVADKLWYEFENPRILNCDRKGIGIRATRKSKPDACLHMKRLIDNGFLKVVHFETIRQLSIFEEVSPNVFKCPRMEHDDCVMSLLWAAYFTMTPFYDELNNKADSKKMQNMTDAFNDGENRMKIQFDGEDEVSMPSIGNNYSSREDAFWGADYE